MGEGFKQGEKMSDERLLQLLVSLSDVIRKIPPGDEYQVVVNRFFALIQHLEGEGLINRGEWTLTPLGRG